MSILKRLEYRIPFPFLLFLINSCNKEEDMKPPHTQRKEWCELTCLLLDFFLSRHKVIVASTGVSTKRPELWAWKPLCSERYSGVNDVTFLSSLTTKNSPSGPLSWTIYCLVCIFCLIMWVTWLQFPLPCIGMFAFPSFQSTLQTRRTKLPIVDKTSPEFKREAPTKSKSFPTGPIKSSTISLVASSLPTQHIHSFQKTCPWLEAKSRVHPFFLPMIFTPSEWSHDKMDGKYSVAMAITVRGWQTFGGKGLVDCGRRSRRVWLLLGPLPSTSFRHSIWYLDFLGWITG